MCYIYTTESFSTMRTYEKLKTSGKQMGLENIILSEVIQTQKDKQVLFYMPIFILQCVHGYSKPAHYKDKV